MPDTVNFLTKKSVKGMYAEAFFKRTKHTKSTRRYSLDGD